MQLSSRTFRSFVLAVGLLTVASLTGLVSRSSAAPAADRTAHVSSSKPWVMGYYPEYQANLMPVSKVPWSGMTHLAVGRVVPNNDGSLNTTYDYDATHGPALAKKLAKAARAHHVVPILMIGGDGAQSQWQNAASHHLSTLAKNLVATMRNTGFAGLDLDWEPIADSDAPLLLNLVDEIKSLAPNAVLTVPVGWNGYQAPEPSYYAQLAKKVDRLDIMGYGMAGAYDGWKTWYSSPLHGAKANTPADMASNVTAYENAGVPAGKIGLGIGFYGTCWAGGVNGPNQTIGGSYIKASDNVMTYKAIMSQYYRASAYHYDATAEAPYLGFSSPAGPQGCTFISYENARSIKAKGAYARAHHLGGAIVWTINQGDAALLKATRKAFK